MDIFCREYADISLYRKFKDQSDFCKVVFLLKSVLHLFLVQYHQGWSYYSQWGRFKMNVVKVSLFINWCMCNKNNIITYPSNGSIDKLIGYFISCDRRVVTILPLRLDVLSRASGTLSVQNSTRRFQSTAIDSTLADPVSMIGRTSRRAENKKERKLSIYANGYYVTKDKTWPSQNHVMMKPSLAFFDYFYY